MDREQEDRGDSGESAGSVCSSGGTVLWAACSCHFMALWSARELDALQLGMVAGALLGPAPGAGLGVLPPTPGFLGVLEASKLRWKGGGWSRRQSSRRPAVPWPIYELPSKTYLLVQDSPEPEGEAL